MKRWIALTACVCLLLCGCTKSNIVYGNNGEDLPRPVDGIVWEQLWEDFSNIYADQSMYPFVDSVNGGIYPEENAARFYLLVNREISEQEAAEYATKVLKGFNDLIAEQNSSYARSGEDSYGGYLSQYEIDVMVGPEATRDDPDTWILVDAIPAGEYRPVGEYAETEE